MAQQICMRKPNLVSSANKESHILITSGKGNSCERRSVNHLISSMEIMITMRITNIDDNDGNLYIIFIYLKL